MLSLGTSWRTHDCCGFWGIYCFFYLITLRWATLCIGSMILWRVGAHFVQGGTFHNVERRQRWTSPHWGPGQPLGSNLKGWKPLNCPTRFSVFGYSRWKKKKRKEMFGLGCSSHSTFVLYICVFETWLKVKVKYKNIIQRCQILFKYKLLWLCLACLIKQHSVTPLHLW